MKIIDTSKEFKIENDIVIALGNFDGLHKGHMTLINTVLKESKNKNISSAIILFREHTRDILKPSNHLYKLTSNNDKINLLKNTNLEYIFIVDFHNIKNLKPEEFFNYLLNSLNCKGIVVGTDYRFGKNASGDIKLLEKLCNKNNITLKIVNTVKDGNIRVKSTIIRSYIREGQIVEANNFLGRNYFITGEVVHGEKRGRELGFPTANTLNNFNYVIPKEGVYYTKTTIISKDSEKKYDSLSFIGNNITFNEYDKKIETYIFDFADSIYGEIIKIEFIEFIRDNYRFNSKMELIEQMNNDVLFVEEYKKNLHF